MLRAVTLDFWDTLFGWDLDPAYEERQVAGLATELSQRGEPRTEVEIRGALRGGYEWFDRT